MFSIRRSSCPRTCRGQPTWPVWPPVIDESISANTLVSAHWPKLWGLDATTTQQVVIAKACARRKVTVSATVIGGAIVEIQLSIISERTLGLPR